MVEIGIIGPKNSGKTTLIEQLIPRFISFGLRVATIKHTQHDHTFDIPGKDSARHSQAGAGATLALSKTEMALFMNPSEEAITATIESMSKQFDLCLVEGDRESKRPKLLLTRNRSGATQLSDDTIIATFGPQPASDKIEHFALDDIASLADWLQRRFFPQLQRTRS